MDPIPVRVRQIVGVVHRNGGKIALKWFGDGAGEGQMGNVRLKRPRASLSPLVLAVRVVMAGCGRAPRHPLPYALTLRASK